MYTEIGLLLTVCLPQDPRPADAPVELAAAVKALHDLAGEQDPARRAAGKKDLLPRLGADLAAVGRALETYRDYPAVKPGVHAEVVELHVGTGLERTRLHIFVPRSYRPGQPAPLLLVGHGTGGEGGSMLRMWRGIAERCGLLLVAPDEAGANVGYAFSARERQSALSALRYMRWRFHVDERRVFVSGVSRGGHLSWDLGLRHPDRFAAIIPMIGGPRIKRVQGQNNLRFIEHLTVLPVCDLQGAKDDPYLVANVRLAFRWLEELGAADAVYHEFPQLGHSFDMGAVAWQALFKDWQRELRPQRVVRRAAGPGPARNGWVAITAVAKGITPTPQVKATARYARLDELQKREYVARAIEKQTARLEAVLKRPGYIEVRARGVRAFELYLDEAMLVSGKPMRVRYRHRTRALAAEPSMAVLVDEFLARQDRQFLPTVRLKIR